MLLNAVPAPALRWWGVRMGECPVPPTKVNELLLKLCANFLRAPGACCYMKPRPPASEDGVPGVVVPNASNVLCLSCLSPCPDRVDRACPSPTAQRTLALSTPYHPAVLHPLVKTNKLALKVTVPSFTNFLLAAWKQ